jgi:hypothetical protein
VSEPPTQPATPAASTCTQIVAALKALEQNALEEITIEDATALLAAIVALTTAKSEQSDQRIPLSDSDITATQAVTIASALLNAQHLNAFDLELWSARNNHRH